MFPRSMFSIRIITTILAISIIINNLNIIIINNRCSSQPFGVMFCRRRRSRSPRPAAGAAHPRAWRLEVSVYSEIDGVEHLEVVEVLPWAYGPSKQSLFDWVAWLHTDLRYGAGRVGLEEAAEFKFFLGYKAVPID